MSKFSVVVFPGETQAYQGTRTLKELRVEGSLTLYNCFGQLLRWASLSGRDGEWTDAFGRYRRHPTVTMQC
jgi:hypothetical protein